MNETIGTNPYLVPVAVVIAGLLIAGAVVWNGNNPSTGGEGAPQGATVDISDVKTDGAPFIGDEDAPTTIAYWSDFQCPFCKQFEINTFPLIIDKYVDTGDVRIVFKDLQFLGPDSTTAGVYARAVWELYPSRYWPWREAMYEAQDEEHGGFGDEASIVALTKTISGIDATKVTQATKANKNTYETMLAADRAEAGSFGISATPSVIIDTQVIAGAQAYAVFEAAIEATL
ncbi:hypothetical protein A3E65_02315 [Candidatus Kaiserbacteria bacterium RIFCSPHIGHO2_12_FULL_56_13]|uniref:Thioredoxin-like fold domain-containing protein n=1 Tax=Candidatus Kaiserbacteria bacterium RIFCSPHIGHO2_12_FULL_56_13 TaxID=1798505 RepID=A0A1F6EFC0_9BACT|nr:MAG: hypothetical protein A3E65_02315 [Candidatus Kaiserbacteria bacterium RIFCSPHIGHO2_12_FULL_56_13]